MIKFSVTKNGKPLSKDLYTWNEETRTFSTNENGLVLDFAGISILRLYTGDYCIFKTGSDCIFKTGSDCVFNTGDYCTFNTGDYCTFSTGYNCTFKTGKNCYLIRYDVEGITEIPTNKTIKLNGYKISGYSIIEEKKETPSFDGKIVEIDGKKYKLIEQ